MPEFNECEIDNCPRVYQCRWCGASLCDHEIFYDDFDEIVCYDCYDFDVDEEE
jgi:hypothetical protein